jgi:hypothetical protein
VPNGLNISPEEFAKLEEPLRRFDARLAKYASQHEMQLSKNYHNIPERSLEWAEDENRKLIQIYLEDSARQTYNIWICASKDINGERYWKNEYLVKDKSLETIESDLLSLLRSATETLRSWKDDDLVPSGARVQLP